MWCLDQQSKAVFYMFWLNLVFMKAQEPARISLSTSPHLQQFHPCISFMSYNNLLF